MPNHVQLCVGEMRRGGTAWLAIDNCPSLSAINVKRATSVQDGSNDHPWVLATEVIDPTSSGPFDAQTSTCFWRDAGTGTLWIKVVRDASAVPLIDDGIGHVIFLDY